MVVGVGGWGVGEGGASEGTQLEDTGSYLAHSGLYSTSSHTPAAVPFYYSNWGTKYMDSALFQSLQLHSSLLPPSLCRALPSLWDLVKTKSHCRGGSGLAQPTGRTQSHKCEVFCTVFLCFS